MPKISERGNIMPESPIRKLVPYAEAAKKRGVKVYHLNIGQPDIPTPPKALEAIKNIDKKVIEYSHSAGNESYRKKIATYYNRLGVALTFNEVLVTTGGSEAIQIAFNATLNPGDEVIMPEPFYTNYNSFALTNGVIIKPITSKIENDFALPAIEEFEKLITPKTKGIIIVNPNNPTGSIYSADELDKIRQLVIKYDLYLYADEVYREFAYDGSKSISVLELEGIDENAIVFDSTSKRYSACGIRVGALISRNKAVIATALKYAQARLSPPGLGQIVGEAAEDTDKQYFKEVYDEYIERRNLVISELNKIKGVYAPMPKGAFYTIIQLPVKDTDRFCQWLLEEFDYEKQTVMLAPASGFYSTPGLGKNEARIAYVLKKDDLRKAVKCLEEALKVYKD